MDFDRCPICLDDMVPGVMLAEIIPLYTRDKCRHKYHLDCVGTLRAQDEEFSNCAVCRAPFEEYKDLTTDQRNLGMSMRIARSTLDQVQNRFELNKQKQTEEKKKYDLEKRLQELEEEVLLRCADNHQNIFISILK